MQEVCIGPEGNTDNVFASTVAKHGAWRRKEHSLRRVQSCRSCHLRHSVNVWLRLHHARTAYFFHVRMGLQRLSGGFFDDRLASVLSRHSVGKLGVYLENLFLEVRSKMPEPWRKLSKCKNQKHRLAADHRHEGGGARSAKPDAVQRSHRACSLRAARDSAAHLRVGQRFVSHCPSREFKASPFSG